MSNNGYIGQLVGPFVSNTDIFRQNNIVASKIGIIADGNTRVKINGVQIEIGPTEIYETNNVYVNSLIFIDSTDNKTVVDYMLADAENGDNDSVME